MLDIFPYELLMPVEIVGRELKIKEFVKKLSNFQ